MALLSFHSAQDPAELFDRNKRALTSCRVADLASRRIHIVGMRKDPDGAQIEWLARNLVDFERGFLRGRRYLSHDRDPLHNQGFLQVLVTVGIRSVKLPSRALNLNAMRKASSTIKRILLGSLIVFGERGLRKAIAEFVTHYHFERNHHGLGNRLIVTSRHANGCGRVRRAEHLGDLLNYYQRVAAWGAMITLNRSAFSRLDPRR